MVSEPMVDEDPAFDSAMYEAHADDATTAAAAALLARLREARQAFSA